jgi:hypothetical protein
VADVLVDECAVGCSIAAQYVPIELRPAASWRVSNAAELGGTPPWDQALHSPERTVVTVGDVAPPRVGLMLEGVGAAER